MDIKQYLKANSEILTDGAMGTYYYEKTENENTISFIKNMKDKVNISLAHTNADYESAKAASEASWKNKQLPSAILLKRFVGC